MCVIVEEDMRAFRSVRFMITNRGARVLVVLSSQSIESINRINQSHKRKIR